jgi:hypothetical protein
MRAAEFSMDKLAERYLELYEEALGRSTAVRADGLHGAL